MANFARVLFALLLCAGPAAAQEGGADSGESGEAGSTAQPEPAPSAPADSPPAASIKEYFEELERGGLIDIETGNAETLRAELGSAQDLLRGGDRISSAVALFTIVETPRYAGFEDFVEYQAAQYYLGVALARSGAYATAIDYLLDAMSHGVSTLYFAPAHRVAVDIALESRDPARYLARLQELKLSEPLGAASQGERSYLQARVAYDSGDFSGAETFLTSVSRRSRMYSSALYLRGIIRTRLGTFSSAAEALCEIVDTPDDDKFSFVVDDRYFRIKDLARLGLGRIAHEVSEYDDAYYHYFQIPEDSDRLAEALFEAGWSMYQKRELATARNLIAEMLKTFPSSPLVPEARLLAGYIELADCKFDTAQGYYDRLVKDLEPVVDELERTAKDAGRRGGMFGTALTRVRMTKEESTAVARGKPSSVREKAVALLRLDPDFVELHQLLAGLRRAAGDAPLASRDWRALGQKVANRKVGAISEQEDIEQAEVRDANGLLGDIRRLQDEIGRSRSALRSAVRRGTLSDDDSEEEAKRLRALESELEALHQQVAAFAGNADDSLAEQAPAELRPLIQGEITEAAALDRDAQAMLAELEEHAANYAQKSIEALYKETRHVLDKAKLGKIDAVIGQKRKLEIEVQDLSAGRFPPELHGQLWEQGLIGDDEEYWPFEGEYWADEYEGWR